MEKIDRCREINCIIHQIQWKCISKWFCQHLWKDFTINKINWTTKLYLMLTVHRRFWYLINSLTILAVLVAMENSCCSVTLERKPLNMKMLGAMTTETLLRVILFLVWWSITRWKNSTNAWGRKTGMKIYKKPRSEYILWRKCFTSIFEREYLQGITTRLR